MVNKREEMRLRDLRDYDILDTEPEGVFDRITRLAQEIFNVPISLLSLVDERRQWFKSKQGITFSETPREHSFCTHTIEGEDPLVVTDALKDDRFRNSPLVTDGPKIRFYAGAPIISPAGYNLGALCVMDSKPRFLSASEVGILRELSRVVVDELELRSVITPDSVTGLMRRKPFLLRVQYEKERATHFGSNFCVTSLFIKNYEEIRTRFGQAGGDHVLKLFTDICRKNVSSADTVSRFGEGEFVILQPDMEQVGSIMCAERICKSVGELLVDMGSEKNAASCGAGGLADPAKDSAALQVTASFETADWARSSSGSIQSLLDQIDERLKKSRTCIVVGSADIKAA